MVSYQKWTAVCFDVAKSKGLETSQRASADLVSLAAEVWNDRKEELETATEAEARRVARSEVQVA
jgi:hypothetical protein